MRRRRFTWSSFVGEYVGNGQGEAENAQSEGNPEENAESVIGHLDCDDDRAMDSSNDTHPLLFFYDGETTAWLQCL